MQGLVYLLSLALRLLTLLEWVVRERLRKEEAKLQGIYETIARKSGHSGEQFATAGRISWEIPSPRSSTVPGPGEYRPDATEGITRIDDLPKPNISLRSRNYRRRPCPRCGHSSYRDSRGRRTLHDLGDPLTGRPRDLIVLYSRHYCSRCRRYFNADMTDRAHPGSHYTRRVVDTAVRLVVEDGLPYRTASWTLWRDHRAFVAYATIQNWVEAGGEKGGAPDLDRAPRLGTLRLLGLHRRRRAV